MFVNVSGPLTSPEDRDKTPEVTWLNQTCAGNDRYTYALDHTMTSATVGGRTTDYTWDVTGAGTYHDTSQGDRYATGARNYDPGTGRFDATDPAAQPATDQAVSTYSYTNARPTVWTDPTGLDPDPGNGMTQAYVDYYTSLNNPEAAATTKDANAADGGTVEIDNPEWLNAKKLVDEAEGFVKAIGVGRRLIDAYGSGRRSRSSRTGDRPPP